MNEFRTVFARYHHFRLRKSYYILNPVHPFLTGSQCTCSGQSGVINKQFKSRGSFPPIPGTDLNLVIPEESSFTANIQYRDGGCGRQQQQRIKLWDQHLARRNVGHNNFSQITWSQSFTSATTYFLFYSWFLFFICYCRGRCDEVVPSNNVF